MIIRRGLVRIGSVCGVCLVVGWLFAASSSADAPKKTIQGTIRVHAALARHLSPGDRLVIKLFHPGNGVELDAKYAILPAFTLPVEFRIAPTFDTTGLVPLGTSGVVLELNTLRK